MAMQENQRIVNLEQTVKQLTNQQQATVESVDDLREMHNNLVEAIEKNDSASAQEMHELKVMVSSIRDLLQAWNDAKGFVRVIGFLATLVKWVGIIGGATGIIWVALKSGLEPDSIKDITGGKK
jgi:type I site-specific restriction endonuclease